MPADEPEVAEPITPRGRGETVGRYVLVDTIGRGGMGVVYTAWDPQLDRRVALKLVSMGPRRPDRDEDTHRARLLREAQALARLEHPNVVLVHDVGVCEGQVFIAMEHIDGKSLRAWLAAERRSLREVLEVYLAAGRGLAAAHAAGLVHRDFKPDNVLVGDTGEVKVADFGLARDDRDESIPRTRVWAETEPAVARALERAASSSRRSDEGSSGNLAAASADADGDVDSLDSDVRSDMRSDIRSGRSSSQVITAAGTVLGTPAYMAPEQHVHATVDARSDQYAFCVSLWEAVYGKRPFSARRTSDLAKRKRKLEIRESSRGLRVPKWLRSLLLRGLSPRRSRRFESMTELLGVIEAKLRERRRRRVPLAIVGVSVALGLGASALLRDDADALQVEACAAPIERLDGVWDAGRRAAIEAQITGSGLVYAADSWARIAEGLDRYREAWLEAEVEVCRAQLEPDHDAAALERRLTCLDARRRELAGLAEGLVRADARSIERATRSVAALTPVSTCAREVVLEPIPLPTAPRLHAQVGTLLDQLAVAKAELDAGEREAGETRARDVLELARGLDWAPLEAEALLTLAGAQMQLRSDPAATKTTLHRAATAALRGEHPRAAVRSWALLALVLIDAREFDEAARWLAYADDLAASLADEYGEDPTLVATLARSRGQLHFAQADYASAEVHARARLDALRGYYGERSPQVADALNGLGVTVYMQYRKDEAVVAYSESLAILEAVHGPEHPSVASAHNNLGVISTDREAYDDALVHYQRALEIRTRVYPPDHALRLQTLTNLANLYLFSGQPGPGVPLAREAVEILTRELDAAAEGLDAAEAAALRASLVPHQLRLGRLLVGTRRWREALPVLDDALARLDAVPGGGHLPPDFVIPPDGDPTPPNLDGCRADLLASVEDARRGLGRSDADEALAARERLPVNQPAHWRRCIDEFDRWAEAGG